VRYGFAIDQRTCIGCHACTVACKTEHEVPVGQFRTWVKYVDRGTFPTSTRDFAVMRCNHCTDAPCVKICPTHALFTRDDGIVDFDGDSCIGCKSCQQACPYDAIYIDENTHTAAKCNFCAHRVDNGLEPACVVVCPTHSIWVGDLDDAESGISKLLDENHAMVRAPEQQTGPNVFYLGADRAVLEPTGAPADNGYIYSTPDPHSAEVAADLPKPQRGDAHTTLNTPHPRPWGWRVTTYLWTKSVGAGAMMLAVIAHLLGIRLGGLGDVVAPVVGLAGVAITGALLVWDLKRPERFIYIFLRPNPRSWLFWGSVVLAAAAVLFAVWLGLTLLDVAGVSASGISAARTGLAVPTLLAAAMTAGYTGFLFGQAEGRDLWQSPLLFWHLLVQAFAAGGGVLVVLANGFALDADARTLLVRVFAVATFGHIAMVLIEYFGRHPTVNDAAAAHMVMHGRYARLFWIGIAAAAVAVVLAATGWTGALVVPLLGGLVAQFALLAYESVFVRAGQDVPLS
jgi:Fe-S-cluster-containing dehydrogenase component/formate-dependent nitrite reductase membrane component NrfD